MSTPSLRVSLVLAALFAPLAFAQERPKVAPAPDETSKPQPVEITPPHGAEGDPHEEMERLMGEVERKMHRVNRLLQEASAGKRPAGAREELGATIRAIDELLKETEASSRSAVSDIDRILELSTHPHPGGT